jgi:hypothetical protein
MYRWPCGEISYTIDPNLPDATRDHVRDAIRRWKEITPIRFIQRTYSNAQYYPNYILFRRPINDKGEYLKIFSA